MAASGRPAPPKPWESAGAQSGPSPFAPSSAANTTAAAIASSTAAENKPGTADQIGNAGSVPVSNMPLRPWEQRQGYGAGGYGTGSYGTGAYGGGSYGAASYGAGGYGGMYNRPYNSYGTSMYGNSSYGSGGYPSSMYGGGMYGSSYGGGMYGNRVGYGAGYGGMPMGGPMGSYGGPMNPNNPDDPYGGPPRPPNFWQSMLTVLHGVMNFFGRLAILIDENTQAFHFFITALLQLCDRAGSLYGELARFVLRLLGVRPRSKGRSVAGNRALAGAPAGGNKQIKAPEAGGAWENVWSASESPQ